ncbi:MAG: tRNA (adenosine(37)-N6)-dimethylallyltransferase MiaA [Corynebacteriales bacterium]|nr:tRNA (adenosine(37)-N6)-dimethylallyltransferase MiaA [Mycobacteriales bacterium]
MRNSSVLVVVGPTATGKSDLAIALAQHYDGEVINADAMQLYRGMDIGTAKLPQAAWGGIPHHVFDLWGVREPASVAEYQEKSRAVIDSLLAHGKKAVVVGGSGLYVRAALDHLEFPKTDPEVRMRWEAALAERGPAVLHAELAAKDPAAASGILPSNGRRIVRALEVIELTGRFQSTMPEPVPLYNATYIGIDLPTPDLDARINARVERMWDAGWVEEVRELDKHGLREGVTASRAIGYSHILRMFDGELSADQAVEITQQQTRRFVRRQRSWFRREKRITWFDAGQDVVSEVISHQPLS